MFQKRRVIAIIAGHRSTTLEILYPQILALKHIFDKCQIWVNADKAGDIQYMNSLGIIYPEFVDLIRLKTPYKRGTSICSFYENCCEQNTVYVRFDDDIVSIPSGNEIDLYLSNLLDNPDCLVTYANVLNAPVNTGRLKIFQLLDSDLFFPRTPDSENGYSNPAFAVNLHNKILESQTLDNFSYSLTDAGNLEYDMSVAAWIGGNMQKALPYIKDNESLDILKAAADQKMRRLVYGGFVCVHYATAPQRSELDKTDILARYRLRAGITSL